MQDDEQDDLLEELREKLELLEEKIDELENLSDTDDISPEVEADILTAKLEGEVPFHVHWIFADDLDYDCSSVDTVVKAQNLFLEKSYEFDADSSKPRVRHGDLFVLMCSHASTSPKDSQNPSLGDKFDDACYYVGMMVDGTAPDQTIPDLPFHPQIGATGVGMTDRKILVWDSCGSSEDCPDDAEAIQIDEVIIPTSGSSPEKGLLVKSQGYRTKLADLTDFQSINFVDNSSASSTTHGLYGADPNTAVEMNNAGILFHLKTLQAKQGAFDVTGTSTKVSLFSTPTTLKETNYEAVTIESKKVSISSDKCGSLSKVSLYGGNSIDVLKSVSGSSNEYDIGTLEASSPVSGSVSLGTLDIPYVSLSGDLLDNIPYDANQTTKYLFAPELTYAEGEKLEDFPDRTIDVVKEVSITVSSPNQVLTDSSGCKYKRVNFSIRTKSDRLVFASGLLVDVKTPEDLPYDLNGFSSSNMNVFVCEGVASPAACGDCSLPDFPFTTAKRYTRDYPTSNFCGINGRQSITVMDTNGNSMCYGLKDEYTWSGDAIHPTACSRSRTNLNIKSYGYNAAPDSDNDYQEGDGQFISCTFFIPNPTTSCDSFVNITSLIPSSLAVSNGVVNNHQSANDYWIFS